VARARGSSPRTLAIGRCGCDSAVCSAASLLPSPHSPMSSSAAARPSSARAASMALSTARRLGPTRRSVAAAAAAAAVAEGVAPVMGAAARPLLSAACKSSRELRCSTRFSGDVNPPATAPAPIAAPPLPPGMASSPVRDEAPVLPRGMPGAALRAAAVAWHVASTCMQ
jgi:hypothetical protein